MKSRTWTCCAAWAALLWLPASAGVTFDFEAASRRLFPKTTAASGANMLEGVTWSTAARISTYSIPNDDPRRVAVRKAAVHKHEGDVWSVEMPDSAIGVCGEALAKAIVSSWTASVKLSDTNGGPYRLSFLYDMRHTLGYSGQAFILFRSGKKNMSHVTEGLSNIEAGGFPYQRDLAVPKGTDEIMVIIRLDGVGKLSFRSPSLMPSPPERPVVLQQGAQGFFDSRFEISEGQPGLLSWLWKRGYGATWKHSDFACRLVVPKGFRLVGMSFADMKDAKGRNLPDGSVEYILPCAGWLRPKEQFSPWHRAGVMILPEGKVGSRGRLSFAAITRNGTSLSDTSTVDLVVTERIKVPMPKRFVGGICPSGIDWMCGSDADKIFARFLADTGTAGILKHTGDNGAHTKAYRDAGIREILRGDSGLANGFCIGPAKGRPNDEKYVFLGKSHRYAASSACPISIYTESEFFRTVTVPWMKKRTEGLDGFWANWEPYSYAGQGCMCDKCRAAFAKYVGVSDEEMAKDWPKELAPRGKWDGKIQRFRSIEHGKLVKTLSKYINFIPGIFWGEMSSVWRPRNLASEVQAIDYARSLSTICPWGPYVYWNTQTPYAPREAPCLTTFCSAKDVRATVDADYPKGSRPRLMGFPSGCSYGTDWVAQPEWIEIQQESFFFNGWASSYPAGFPRGYDARYWRAFARANAMAARYEDFVYDGRRVDATVRILPSKGEKPFGRLPKGSRYLDWMTNGVSYVQHVAYSLGNRSIVAVFNFSDAVDTRVDVLVDGKVRYASLRVPACSCRVVELGGGRTGAESPLPPGKAVRISGDAKALKLACEQAYRMGVEYVVARESDLKGCREEIEKFTFARTQRLVPEEVAVGLLEQEKRLDFSSGHSKAAELAASIHAEEPLQLLACGPASYLAREVFPFVHDLPTTWDETRSLDGGLTARRKGDDWYLARLPDGKPCELSVDIGFAGHGRRHLTLFAEALSDRVVSTSDALALRTAADGSLAARLVRPITLFIAGDSTTSYRPAHKTQGSWADELKPSLASDVRIFNCAVGGRSTKSFRVHWDHDIRPYLKAGDWVLIQFGANDAVKNQHYRSCTPEEYAENLRTFVKEVRGAGAEALLASPLSQRRWNSKGEWGETFSLAPYTAAMEAVARELKVPYVDMSSPTSDYIKAAGAEGSLSLFNTLSDGRPDNVHPARRGAKAFAGLFIESLRRQPGHPARRLFTYARDLGRVRVDVPRDADRQVEMAVAELKALLAEKSGSVVDAAAPFRFVFGRPEGAPPAAPFESRYRIDGDTVWLWGDDGGTDEIWDWGDDRGSESQRRRGTLFAVELFAEEQLGFDWAWPGADGLVVAKSRKAMLPIFAEGRFETALTKSRIRNYAAYTPFTREQVIGLMPPGLYEDEKDYPLDHTTRAVWQNRNRLQDREYFTYGHAFTDWYDRFFKTHPEYLNYHAADGSRGWTGSSKKKSVKLCVSNPAVADQIVADWLASGTNRYVNICENDGVYWCECDGCRALDEPKASIDDIVANKACLSDRYATFWNRVAERARKYRPDVRVVTYAYSAYRYPPKRVKIEHPDNMVFGFVSGDAEDGVGMVREWQKVGMKHFFFRPNHLHYMGTIHRGLEKQFYDEFQAMMGLGMIGCDYDANVNRATIAIEFYVMAKTIADPSLSFEEIVSGYYAAYGAAAPDVRRYYEAVRATCAAKRERLIRERHEQPEFFAEARKDVPRTQEFGRSEEELVEKKAMLDDAVERHAAAGDLSAVEMRRLKNLALQAEHGVLTYRFLVSVTDLPVGEMKARAKALNDFRVAHKSELPDLYTKVYRIWWGEIRYWKIYFRRCSSEKTLKEAGL